MRTRFRMRRPAVLSCLAAVLLGAIVAGLRLSAPGAGHASPAAGVPRAALLGFEPESLAAAVSARPAADTSTPTAPSKEFGPVSSLLTASPNVTYTSGSLGFGAATVVDFQRTEGEPLGHIDKNGNYWESGPWGFSTAQSFIHRSTDGGDQFNVVSPVDLRPNSPPGGGDSTIVTDDQGYAYFSDLEAVADIDCSVSNDNGNTWVKQPECAHTTGTDRNWLIVDNGATQTIGPAGAADNTVFFAYHDVATGHFLFSSPGSTGLGSTGGLLFTNAMAGAATATLYAGSGNCAQLTFDPVNRNLYYACGGAGGAGVNCPSGPTGPVGGRRVDVTIVHVNPGARTGLTATTKALPSTPMCLANLFPVLSVDSAGNVYVVWTDTGDHNIYYSYSTDAGQTWSPVIRINNPPAPATTGVFSWSQAGGPGMLAAIYLQAASDKVSDVMPNWNPNPQNNPPGGPALATQYKWYGEVSLIRNANTPNPTIDDNRFTEKPIHYGQVCNSGIGCTVTFGDRTMADYLSVQLDGDGALRIVYNDTTSQHHGAHVFETRQLKGPTLTGGTLSKPLPSNPMFDAAGDAQWPHYSPAGAGPNQGQLDLRSLAVNQQTASTLRFRMTFNNLGGAAGFLPPAGKANAFAIARFQALSRDDTNAAEAYRIFYVGVESVGGSGGVAPVFFAGSPNRDAGAAGTPGCNSTTPGNCKVVQYPPEFVLTTGGQISGNTICIDVPLTAFDATRPINGSPLFNVTAFTGGRNVAPDDIYADVDSTRGFDFTLGTISPTACLAPTALKVAAFSGHASRGGVVLRWRTGSELEMVGFNVWRLTANGKTRVNRSLIAASGGAGGERYSFVDRTARREASYTYRLQIVNRNGTRSWHGSARVRLSR
jgi:hypothetical protein